MRIRIVQKPPQDSIDGLQLDRFETGYTYEVGTTIGALLLAEGWGEPAVDDGVPQAPAAAPPVPIVPFDPDNPPNLRREVYPPYLDRLELDIAADLERRRRSNERAAGARNGAPPPSRRKRDRRR